MRVRKDLSWVVEPGPVDLLDVLARRPPAPAFGVVAAPAAGIPHVVIGLWAATLVVLLAPGGNRPTNETDVMRAWGVCTPLFALL